MTFWKYRMRTITAAVTALTVMAALSCLTGCHVEYEDEIAEESAVDMSETQAEYSLRFTYTDETYTEFFEACAKSFENKNPGVTIELELADKEDYIEKLSNASLDASTVSDLYMTDNASLGTAYLAGLAATNTIEDPAAEFGPAAIAACSYNGIFIAYPLSYKTTFLAYNKDYVPDGTAYDTFSEITDFAGSIYGEDDLIEDDNITAEESADTAEEETAEGESEGETETAEEQIDYSAVEAIFDCNLTDLFLNYAFLGGGMDIGGTDGSDASTVTVCTEDAVKDAGQYQNLIGYFSISTTRDYASVYDRFIQKKTIFTILSTDSIADLQALNAEEETESAAETAETSQDEASETAEGETAAPEVDDSFHYGFAAIPDYNDSCTTAPISITQAIVVNPFSTNTEIAAEFARYITCTQADELFPATGALSANRNAQYDDPELKNIYLSYNKSVPKNKLQFGEQIYPLIEIALHNIVAGNDISTELTSIDDYMKTQLQ